MYINIGKAILSQSVGLQDNYKTITLTNKQSECAKCPWFQAANSKYATQNTIDNLQTKCKGCSGTIGYDINYQNEKNKYGYKEALCKNATLLLLILHTYNPTQAGFIENINVDILADRMNLHVRTIRNNLTTLVKKNYIYCENIYAKHINIILLDYRNYFLKADKGGRGYIKLSYDTIMDLCKIKSVLVLRLTIRELLTDKDEDTKTYRELSRCLPKYCKRHVIQNKLYSSIQGIFSIDFVDKYHVKFSLFAKCNAKKKLQEETKEYENYYSTLLDQLNDFVLEYKNPIKENIPVSLRRFLILDDDMVIQEPVLWNQRSINETIPHLAKLACKYSEKIVTNALADTYRLSMCKRKKLITHVGRYVLEVIRSYGLIDGHETSPDFTLTESTQTDTTSATTVA